MRKIRVAFFADMLLEDFDGCTRTIHQLLSRLDRDRYEVLCITGVGPKKPSNIKTIEIPTLSIPINKSYRVALPFFVKQKIKQELNKFNPDIIHFSNPSPLGKMAVKYALTKHLPLLSIYHTHFISYVKYYLYKFPAAVTMVENHIANIYKKIYDHCDIVYLPISEFIPEFKKHGLHTDHCQIWPRGIDNTLFSPSKKDNTYLQKLTKNNKTNILFASRLVWEKNLKTLIGLYDKIEDQNLPYNLIIAGSGTAESKIKIKMPKAFFMGNLSHKNLSKLYASADVFFFPSDTETYGNVIVEAMASGLPCIAANAGGPKGIIQHGKTGFLCPSHDIPAYLHAITQLTNDSATRERIISNALAYSQELSWTNLVHSYQSDIEAILALKTTMTA